MTCITCITSESQKSYTYTSMCYIYIYIIIIYLYNYILCKDLTLHRLELLEIMHFGLIMLYGAMRCCTKIGKVILLCNIWADLEILDMSCL